MKNRRKMIVYWLVIAGLVGLISGFRHWLIPIWSGTKTYSPLVLNNQSPSLVFDETIYYAPKVRESLDGHYLLNDPFVWEYKTTPSPYNLGEALPALIMAALARLSGSVANSFMVADFIFPPIIFLGLTYLFYRLTKLANLAPLAAVITMFFYKYFDYFPYLPSIIIKIFLNLSEGSISDIVRSFHPQVTLPFFLLFTGFLWRIHQDNKKTSGNWQTWALGLSLGSLFYSYIFFWTYALTWMGITIGWAWLSKRFYLLRRLLFALLVAIIIAGPYLFTFRQFFQLPISQSFIKNGQMPAAAGSGWLSAGDLKQLGFLVILLGFSWLTFKKKWVTQFWPLFYTAGISLLISWKVSGLKAEDMREHWMLQVVWPLTLFFLILVIGQSLKSWFKKKNSQKLIIGLTILLLIYQARIHWQYYKIHADLFWLETERVELFKWLNQNTAKDSVVVTSGLTDNLYLPVYTHNNVFISRGFLSIVPAEEALERFLIVNKIATISDVRIKDMLSLTESNLEMRKKGRFNFDDCAGHHLYFRRFIGKDYYNCSVPENQLELILSSYEKLDNNLNHWREKYRMDYWLWGPQENQWARVNPDDLGWQLIWQNQDYKLFKLP